MHSGCYNLAASCPFRTYHNYCTNDKWKRFMYKNCKKSCGYCGNGPAPTGKQTVTPTRATKKLTVTKKPSVTYSTGKYKHFIFHSNCIHPANFYLLKVNNRNAETRCEICSKLTRKTPERRQWHRSGVFIVNFERISHLVLVFPLLTLRREMLVG